MAGRILIFVPVYLFLLLFVASPRLLLPVQDPSPTAVATFPGGTGYHVWSALAGSVR